MLDKEAHVEAIYKCVMDSCFEVHKSLGPGLLELVYARCLEHELKASGLYIEVEK